MSPAQIMLFYLTRKTAAASWGKMINPWTLGTLTGSGAYVGSRLAGQDPLEAGTNALTMAAIGGSSATKAMKHNLGGGDPKEALKHLEAGNLANSTHWKHNPITNKSEFSYFDPSSKLTKTVAHDDPAVKNILERQASRIKTDTILKDIVRNKLALTAAAAGVSGLAQGVGMLGDARAVTSELRKNLTGDQGLIGDTKKKFEKSTGKFEKAADRFSQFAENTASASASMPALVGNLTKSLGKAGDNLETTTGNIATSSASMPALVSNLSNTAKSVGSASESLSKLPQTVDQLGKDTKTFMDSTASSVNKGAEAADRVSKFLTSPKTWAIGAAGAATLALGYILYKHMSSPEEETPKAPSNPSAPRGGPRKPRKQYAPLDHSHPEIEAGVPLVKTAALSWSDIINAASKATKGTASVASKVPLGPVAGGLATGGLGALAATRYGDVYDKVGLHDSAPNPLIAGGIAALPGIALGLGPKSRKFIGATGPRYIPHPTTPGAFTQVEKLKPLGAMAMGVGVPMTVAPLAASALSAKEPMIAQMVTNFGKAQDTTKDVAEGAMALPEAVKKTRDLIVGAADDPTKTLKNALKGTYEASGAKDQIQPYLETAKDAIYDVGGGLVGGTAGGLLAPAVLHHFFGPRELNPGEKITEEEANRRSNRSLLIKVLGIIAGGYGGMLAGQAGAKYLMRNRVPDAVVPKPNPVSAPTK